MTYKLYKKDDKHFFHKNMSRLHPGQKSIAGITTTVVRTRAVRQYVASVWNRIAEHVVAHPQGRYPYSHV